MPGAERLVYLDAGIYIAWFSDEPRPPEDRDGIAYFAMEADAGRITPVTATLTRVEVLDSKLPAGAVERFRAYLKRPELVVVNLTSQIADIAHEVRDFYAKKSDGLGPVSSPDAIHLATAINYKCPLFLTFDAKGGPQKSRPLLSIESPVAGRYQLRIEQPRKPPAPQGALFGG